MSEAEKSAIDVEIAKLAQVPTSQYDTIRKERAKNLGIRACTLDSLVDEARKRGVGAANEQGSAMPFAKIDPWESRVDGAALLSETRDLIGRHLILPPHADVAISLWIAFSYLHEAFFIAPLLAITSPEKRCGKTTLVSLLSRLASNPMPASNISPAALFRSIDKWAPTLLIDEADTFLRGSEDLRGIVNSGHSRDAAYVVRVCGEEHEPRRFSTWAPKAIALIGGLPDTLHDRSIVVALRRKRPSERTQRLQLSNRDAFEHLRRQFVRWAADIRSEVENVVAEAPPQLNDRAADNWRPLLAIAQLAGGQWAGWALTAAIALTDREHGAEAPGARLLRDIRDVFSQRGDERIDSYTLMNCLAGIEEAPWADWHNGHSITLNQMAALLKPFKIRPHQIWRDGANRRGYELKDFAEAFDSYLEPLGPLANARPLDPCKNGHSMAAPSGANPGHLAARLVPMPLETLNSSDLAPDQPGYTASHRGQGHSED